MAINEQKMNELLGRFLNDFGGTFHCAMAVIGEKLGLYKALAEAGPLTSEELAKRTVGPGERTTVDRDVHDEDHIHRAWANHLPRSQRLV